MRTTPVTLGLTVLVFLFFTSAIPADAEENTKEQVYVQWLKKNKALDAYARLLQKRPASPENTLRLARTYYDLGRYQKVRNLLAQNEAQFLDDLEGQRLILLGQAHRNLNEYEAALNYFSRASSYMNPQTYKNAMHAMADVSNLFIWVWKKHFWKALTPDQLNDGQIKMLTNWSKSARIAWPDSKFWKYSQQLINSIAISFKKPLFSGTEYTQEISRLFAAWSLKNYDKAEQILNVLKDDPNRNFWFSFNSYLKNNAKAARFSSSSFAGQTNSTGKTAIFSQVFEYELNLMGKEQKWNISDPDIPGWDHYQQNLDSLSEQERLNALIKEHSSTLLSTEVKTALYQRILAYRLLNQRDELPDFEEVKNFPMCLQLALALSQNNPQFIHYDKNIYAPLMRELLLAAGMRITEFNIYKIWDEASSENEDNNMAKFFDYLDNYRELQQAIEKDQEKIIASKGMAFLFPNTPSGQSAFLYLARKAYAQGRKELAWKYLQKIRANNLNGRREAELLKAKAGVLMDLGREKDSLGTYALLIDKYPQALSPAKKLKLALAAQQKDNWKWAEKILNLLWLERSNLNSALQAEVLFWIGEGQQMQGKIEAAIDSYLQVACKYRKENIWAVTAMYRAGLLYQERGMLDAAQNLYKMVLKNADRDSQKKAANQRLKAVETEQKKKGGGTAPLF